MKSLTIIGRRWFEKSCGNTYHSVEVYVDGSRVYHLPFEYGYGSMYLQNAETWLAEKSYLKDMGQYEHLRTYCERMGIAFVDSVTDVARKKDL